jgi:2-(1,2-epoxy-1,2-dihydrophenyl)acetyl-CoA isomerase
MGDLVVAAESAKFTMAYTNVGLSPDGSSSYFLPRLIGLRRTQELMLTNRVLSAQEALDWGLVTKVVSDDQLMQECNELASRFARGAKGSNAAVKKLLLESFSNDLEAQMEIEGNTIAACADSSDGKEGVTAFIEQRTAEFS